MNNSHGKAELILRLKDIEWDDSEVKGAQNKLPDNVWETVSAFSSTQQKIPHVSV